MDENEQEAHLLLLLGEKYTAMRKKCEQLWNRERAVQISASEWYVLSKINGNQLSISMIARSTDMTRQAAHKYISGLSSKGILKTVEFPENRRDKYVEMTPFGRQCWTQNLQLQLKLEKQIAKSLGDKNMRLLKSLLDLRWNI